MRVEIAKIREKWCGGSVIPDVSVGFGINTGEVVVGNVGAMKHMEYTGMGSTVNLASRLESNAHGNQILISESTCEAVKSTFEIRPLPPIHVKGKLEEVTVFEVIGPLKPRLPVIEIQ
jgi:adenylate cyclase